MFRVIIAGGRDFADYTLLSKTMDEYLSGISDDISIVCGQAFFYAGFYIVISLPPHTLRHMSESRIWFWNPEFCSQISSVSALPGTRPPH